MKILVVGGTGPTGDYAEVAAQDQTDCAPPCM